MRGSAAFRIGVVPGGVLAPAWVRDALWRNARAVPSLDLNFAANKSLVDATTGQNLVTFTRASSGTYVGSDGLLKTATTNLLLRSEDLTTTWTNFNSTEAADTAIAPNGTLTADALIPNNGVSDGLIRQDISSSLLPDGSSVTFSVYVKTAGLTNFAIQFYNKANTFHTSQTVNASTGNLSGSGTLTTTAVSAVGDGWYRVSVTGMTAGSGATTPNIRVVVTSTGNGTSGIYLWGAQLEQSSTVGEYIPTTSTVNSAPRFDHNPTTGESLGLLVEEQRTNSIRNNTMVGAVAGTPGTLPTNWTLGGAAGLTTSVVGTGTQKGISYVDLRLVGTSTGTFTTILFEPSTQVAATNAQAWAISSYIGLVGGSLTGSSVSLTINQINSAGSLLAQLIGSDIASSLNSSLTRFSFASTTNQATIAYVRPLVSVNYNSGAAIDITLRIGLPQLEQGAFATSVIPTSTAAATRSADVASITGANFSSWYSSAASTMRVQGTLVGGAAASFPYMATIAGPDKDNNIIGIPWTASSSVMRGVIVSGGSGSVDLNIGPNKSSGSSYSAALAASATSANLAVDGLIASDDTTVTLPVVTQLLIGQPARFQPTANTTIRRLTYWPARLSNSTLQAITQ